MAESFLIDGILLVNKHSFKTSNTVLQIAKRLFQAKKAGHTGSLDPLATGMLPVCFGEATKFSQYLLDADKCYEVTGILGVKTDTSDSMGQIIAQTTDINITVDKLEHVISTFTGHIEQVPSMFSALKHQGKPLYKYAREGQVIERKARPIHIQSIELVRFDNNEFDLVVHCSKGTYIRNLVEDIGEALGVGAHVSRLHRQFCAGFSVQPMHTINYIESLDVHDRQSLLLPCDQAIIQFPKLNISQTHKLQLQQGKQVNLSLPSESAAGRYRLYDSDGHFFGLGIMDDNGLLSVNRLMSY